MNGNGQSHPARSVDFLSRLHDGELDAGERARFESHRAHCAECRRAVVEFEDAIALFRSARSSPPRLDLAGRILRKVQSTNRPRSPFPRRFQIDLGWAALLLTALFAVLVTTPILLRNRPVATSPTAPTPGPRAPIVAQAPPSDSVAPRSAPETSRRKGKPIVETGPGAPQARREAPVPGKVAAAPKAEGKKTGRLEPLDSSEMPKAAAQAAPVMPEAATAGGEGGASARSAPASAPLHVSVREADGFGAPPPLRSPARLAVPLNERGLEYAVLVDSQGNVRAVTPAGAISDALSRLRFEAGSRPRRLIVRFD